MSLTGFFLATGGISLIAAAHPFLTYPLSLSLFAPRRPSAQGVRVVNKPSVALCLSAYQEEAVIVEKIESMLEMAAYYGPATIHVFVDGGEDRTAELLAPYKDRVDLVVSPERRGKTFGMNHLLGRSQSELVMFSDANVIASKELLDQLIAPFSDPAVGCATATLVYSNAVESSTSFAGAVYWSIEERIKQIEADTVGVIGVDGASFVVRRELYHPAPSGLIDDFYVTLKVMLSGAHVFRVRDAIVQERSAVDPIEESLRKRRITCQALNVHKALWPELKRLPGWQLYSYLSHRLIKWMMPFFIALAILSFSAAAILSFGWLAALVILSGALLTVIGGWFNLPIFSFVYSALLSLFGVGRGFFESMFLSKSYVTWEPAQSVRSS